MRRDRGGPGDGGGGYHPGDRDPPGGTGRCGREGEPFADGDGPAGERVPHSGKEDRHQPGAGRSAQARERVRRAHRPRDHRRLGAAGPAGTGEVPDHGRAGTGREYPLCGRNPAHGGTRRPERVQGSHSPGAVSPGSGGFRRNAGIRRPDAGRCPADPGRKGRFLGPPDLEHGILWRRPPGGAGAARDGRLYGLCRHSGTGKCETGRGNRSGWQP